MPKIKVFRKLFPTTIICVIFLMLLIFLSRTFNIDSLVSDENARFQMYLNNIQVLTGNVFLAFGLLAFIIAIILSIRNRHSRELALWGAISILTGLLLILPNLNLYQITITNPIFIKLQNLFLMLIFGFFFMLTLSIIKKVPKWAKWIIMILFAYPLVFMAINDFDFQYYMLLAYPVIMITSLVLFFFPVLDAVRKDGLERTWIYAGYLIFGVTFTYDFAAYVYGISESFSTFRYYGILLFLVVSIIIVINKFILADIRKDERKLQVMRNSVWNERIIRACALIFAQKEIVDFCIQTAKSMKELILNDLSDQCDMSYDEINREENISIKVGLKNGEHFTDIYAEGNNDCDYKKIEQKRENKFNNQVFFGNSYMDMLLFEKENLKCIIHFEGITKGLSENLKNIIMIAYSNISVAFDNLSLKFDLTKTQETIFFNLADISEAKSEETGEHLKRVAEYVKVMCEEMMMSPKQVRIVSQASMMHDVGKLAIPEEIITKKGILTAREYEVVKQHVLYGYHIMSKSPGEFMQAAAIIAQQHHERWNGDGYLGLKGEEIHPYARIVSLVDVFDALMTERSYKKAWSFEQTCSYINAKSGIQFDPAVVEVFNRVFYRLLKIRETIPN